MTVPASPSASIDSLGDDRSSLSEIPTATSRCSNTPCQARGRILRPSCITPTPSANTPTTGIHKSASSIMHSTRQRLEAGPLSICRRIGNKFFLNLEISHESIFEIYDLYPASRCVKPCSICGGADGACDGRQLPARRVRSLYGQRSEGRRLRQVSSQSRADADRQPSRHPDESRHALFDGGLRS